MKKCGELIFEIRKSLNLSLRKFGEKCGLSHSYISKLEKGIDPSTGTPVNPSLVTIKLICSATNYPLDKFLYEIGYINNVGYFHDIGKTNDNFQNIVKKSDKSIDDYSFLNYDSKENIIKQSNEEEELLKDFRLLDKYEKRIIKGRITEMLYNKEIEKNSPKVEFSDELVNMDFKDKSNK